MDHLDYLMAMHLEKKSTKKNLIVAGLHYLNIQTSYQVDSIQLVFTLELF